MGLCAASTGRAVSRTANLSAVGFAVRGHIIRHVEGQPRRDALFQFFDLELDLLLFFLQSKQELEFSLIGRLFGD